MYVYIYAYTKVWNLCSLYTFSYIIVVFVVLYNQQHVLVSLLLFTVIKFIDFTHKNHPHAYSLSHTLIPITINTIWKDIIGYWYLEVLVQMCLNICVNIYNKYIHVYEHICICCICTCVDKIETSDNKL